MCAKFNQIVYRIIPDGPVKETFKSSYYRFYYNSRHFRENEFYVYYTAGHFEYRFDTSAAPNPALQGGVVECRSVSTLSIPRALVRRRSPSLENHPERSRGIARGSRRVDNGITFSSHDDITDELKRSLKGYLAKHAIREGETVVDCGAYIGEFTLYAAKAVGPSGRVIAFEPDPAIHKRLTANIELNGFTNVTVLNKGVWSKAGTLKFVGDSIKGYSFMSAEKDAGAIDVPVASLDDELKSLNMTKVDFIKMDVEGAELEALKGMERTLKGHDVDLAIASYHLVDGARSCCALEKMLAGLGYKAETGHPGHLTTYAWKGSSNNAEVGQ